MWLAHIGSSLDTLECMTVHGVVVRSPTDRKAWDSYLSMLWKNLDCWNSLLDGRYRRRELSMKNGK